VPGPISDCVLLYTSAVYMCTCVCVLSLCGREVVQHLNDKGVAAWPAEQCLLVFVCSTVQVCRAVSGQSCEESIYAVIELGSRTAVVRCLESVFGLC